jgi:cellulose biosynthesis protein BcsQ
MLGKIMCIWNNKGGMGKTTLAQSLSCVFGRKLKDNLLLVDSDSQANITDSTLVKATFSCNLYDVIIKQKRLRPHRTKFHYDLVAGDYSVKNISSDCDAKTLMERVDAVFSEARATYPLTIIDCSPSLEGDMLKFILGASDYILIPLCPLGLNEIGSTHSAIKYMRELKIQKENYQIILNMVRNPDFSDKFLELLHTEVDKLAKICKLFPFAVECDDNHMEQSQLAKSPPCFLKNTQGDYNRDILRLVNGIKKTWDIPLPKSKIVEGR